MESPRVRRVAERIHEVVATAIAFKLKDPRVRVVTVTDVRVTGDLQNATVFYTVLGGEREAQGAAKALESAKGMIRSMVGKQLGLRLTPTLTFTPDALPDAAHSIEVALMEAQARDAAVAKLAEGKEYANGENPYRE